MGMRLRWVAVLAAVVALTAGQGVAAGAAPLQVDPNAPHGQCADAVLRVRVIPAPEGSGAGQRLSYVDFQNRGTTSCVLRGAPGISLVGHGNGTQLGRPADRPSTGTAPTVRLAPGQSARVGLSFVNVDKGGGPYADECKAVHADGYRVYPPHSYRAVFVKSPQYACSNPKVHWGGIDYLQARPVGCATTAGRVPAGAVRRSIADVDGDAQRDTEWITSTRVGITTASGATTSIRPDVQGGADPRALSVVLQGSSRAITLVAGSRDVQVFRFARSTCTLRPVLNRQGHQYRFDLSGRYGDGVTCSDPDRNGVDQLTGLKTSAPLGALRDGDQVTISATVVGVSGLRAVNGRTRTSTATWPADRATIERAATITCGTLTLQHDGITAPD